MKINKSWLIQAKRGWFTSVKRSMVTNALFVMSLLPLLTISGCSKVEYVPVNPPKINPELTADTPVPKVPTPFRWADNLELNAKLYIALGQCNLDKAAIREIESTQSR